MISAFSRINGYISRDQSLTIYNAVILANFNYCRLIWLLCNKGANNEVDRTNKRALQTLYKNYQSTFEVLPA